MNHSKVSLIPKEAQQTYSNCSSKRNHVRCQRSECTAGRKHHSHNASCKRLCMAVWKITMTRKYNISTNKAASVRTGRTPATGQTCEIRTIDYSDKTYPTKKGAAMGKLAATTGRGSTVSLNELRKLSNAEVPIQKKISTLREFNVSARVQ